MKEQFSLRLPEDLLARIDAHRDRVNEDHPGYQLNRTDVIRALLLAALSKEEEGR